MSATRDTSQKIAFLYSNVYSIYKKGQTGPVAVIKSTEPAKVTENPIQNLKDNLKALDTLHLKLKQMIVELEDLVK